MELPSSKTVLGAVNVEQFLQDLRAERVRLEAAILREEARLYGPRPKGKLLSFPVAGGAPTSPSAA